MRKIASGVITLYHYDYAGNLIAETDGIGTCTCLRDYVYLNVKVYSPQAEVTYRPDSTGRITEVST